MVSYKKDQGLDKNLGHDLTIRDIHNWYTKWQVNKSQHSNEDYESFSSSVKVNRHKIFY